MAAGRPRQFDINEALDQALHVFWEKGYEGASMPDLTKAMGINRPSIYAAFGNKEELFRAALDRYSEKFGAFVQDALAAPTARQAIELFLRKFVEKSVDPNSPRGCMLMQAMACGEEDQPIRKELAARRSHLECALFKRFDRGQKEGDLSKDVEAGDLARFYATLAQGMKLRAADGATRKELDGIVRIALDAWPA